MNAAVEVVDAGPSLGSPEVNKTPPDATLERRKPVLAPSEEVSAAGKVESAVKSVHVDGALYVAIGFLTALLVCLESDEAAKVLSAVVLWVLRTVAESVNGGLLALKMFRSTSFAQSKGKA